MSKQKSLSQAYSLLEKKIREILKVTKGKYCIFRGEDAHYDKISSTLYREQARVIESIKNKPKDILSTLDIPEIEKKNIEKARRLFSDATSDIEILTQLQHYGGATSLIDFTRNVHIALFKDRDHAEAGCFYTEAMADYKEAAKKDMSLSAQVEAKLQELQEKLQKGNSDTIHT